MRNRAVRARRVTEQPVAAGSSAALRVMTVVLAAVALVALAAALVMKRSGSVNGWLVLAMLVLTVAATQRVAIFGDETAINSSIVILLGVAATAVAGAPLWVPAVCGLAAGLHWEHVRNRASRKLVVNASCTTLAVLAAAELGRVTLSVGGSGWIAIGSAAVLSVVAYWTVNNVLVAAILAAADGDSPAHHIRDLTRSETELLPVAALGFLAGFVILRDLGAWPTILVLVGLLVVTDQVVVRRLTTRSVRRTGGIAVLASGVVLVVGASAYGASAERFPSAAPLPILLGLGVLASVVVVRIRPSLTRMVLVVCVAAAVVVFHRGDGAVAPLLVMIGVVVPVVFAHTRRATRLRLIIAIALATMAMISTTAFLPSSVVSSVSGAALVGLLCGLSGLLGWHSSTCVGTLRDRGIEWLVALDMLRTDTPAFLVGGVVGGLVGWIGLTVGDAFMGCAVAVALAIGAFVSTRRLRMSQTAAAGLSDHELLDVVRSSVLDLPASRLPPA